MRMINQTVGDALSDMLLVEAALIVLGLDLPTWEAQYTDLPNRLSKVNVGDTQTRVGRTVGCAADNEDVKEGRPVTPEARAHARDIDERVATEGAAAAADIFTAPEAPLEPAPSGDDISGEDFLSAISTPRD